MTSRIAFQMRLQFEILKADLLQTLRERYGEDREKWIRVLEATLSPNFVRRVPKHQRVVMTAVLQELKEGKI